MRRIVLAAALLVSAAAPHAHPALAADAPGGAGPTAPAGPTPEAVRLAASVVARRMANHDAQVKAVALPLADLMQRAGKLPPERARALVDEVIVPTLEAHWSSLREGMVRSYASGLSVDDLRALDAFYATPSGARFLAAEPRLTAAYLGDLNRWIAERAPDVSARVKAVWSAHGWSTAPTTAVVTPPAAAGPGSPPAPPSR